MPQTSKILLIEDAPDCQLLVKEALARSSDVRIASSLGEARALLGTERFELIILDLSLPDGDGMEFFSRLQGAAAVDGTPVIFLTARTETASQVAAFTLGADDYVVKPIRPVEFRARVEAKLRRIAVRRSGPEAALSCGELTIELGTQKATLAGRELDLTGREFKILCQLARNAEKALSREQLIQAVWGSSVHVLDRTVDTHVYTLRKKLGGHAHYIVSEVGLGYRLSAGGAAKEKAAA
jgi:two-component system alkaline phosphatase synthesis response regulator PhoP